MDERELTSRFLNIRMFKGDGGRAPNKPLLLLYALGELLYGKTQYPYDTIDKVVRRLLQDFGPQRKVYHPEYPFWRLQADNIWEVTTSKEIRPNKSGDVSPNKLIDAEAQGNFSQDIEKFLIKDQQVIKKLIAVLLEENFPETIHEDILQAIGVDLSDVAGTKRRRCPKFRDKVLQAYEYRCAVCGFDVRIGHYPVALEAAHIKWHMAGGPESEENGIALCSLHHKLFDRGAFTLSQDKIILVSDKANGTESFQQWLMQYHGEKIRFPQREQFMPDLNFTSWHTKEVFQGTYRDIW